jgi:ABC-type transport system substrate-binding protein
MEHGNTWGASTGAAYRFRAPTMSVLLQRSPYDYAAPLIPELAYGWTVHDDGRGVTFFLRDGVKWHNGADFTCEHARFSFEIMMTGEGLTHSYMKAKLENVDSSSPVCGDDSTLQFQFTSPSATPMLGLGEPHAFIFNKEWFLAGGEDAMFQDMSVGTGPFIWSKGQTVGDNEQHFEKNPDYFIEELPYVDELVIFGILDESAQQAAMLAHQADWHWVRNWGQYDTYVEHDQIVTVVGTTLGQPALNINTRKPPLDNVRVRQALFMGIDRNAGIAVLQQGHGSLGFLMPAGSPWELDQERGCAVPGWCPPEDMEAQRSEARKMLEEEGFDFNKTYAMTVESDPQVIERGTFVQEQLRLSGIKTEFDQVETIAIRTMLFDGTWGDFMPYNEGLLVDDPGVGLGHRYRCDSIYNAQTPGTECDAKLEDLFDQVDSAFDPVERQRLSDEIQLYIMEQYWKLPLFWEQEAQAWWPEVRGFAAFPESSESFRKFAHMWIDPAHKDDSGFSGQTVGPPGGN